MGAVMGVFTCPKVEYRNTGISATVMARACAMDIPSPCFIDILVRERAGGHVRALPGSHPPPHRVYFLLRVQPAKGLGCLAAGDIHLLSLARFQLPPVDSSNDCRAA